MWVSGYQETSMPTGRICLMTSLFLLSPVNRVNKPSASVGNLTFSKYLQHSQPTRTWQILSIEVLQLPQSSTRKSCMLICLDLLCWNIYTENSTPMAITQATIGNTTPEKMVLLSQKLKHSNHSFACLYNAITIGKTAFQNPCSIIKLHFNPQFQHRSSTWIMAGKNCCLANCIQIIRMSQTSTCSI